MGKVIRLTESELIRIIKKVIEEQKYNPNIRPAVDNTRTNITARNYNAELQLRKNIKELSDCSKLWAPLLPKAKDYWKKWLTHDLTKQKIAKNNFNGDLKMASEVIDEYLKLLPNFQLSYYNDRKKNALAHVNSNDNKNIYINCAYKSGEESMLANLIHEIQHTFYFYRPMNPASSISNIFDPEVAFKKFFVNSSSQGSDKSIKDVIGKQIKNSQQQTAIQKIAKTFNINQNDPLYRNLSIYITNLEQSRTNKYTCRETENMSRIMAIRQLFGIDDPTQKINVDMLKPYFTRQKSNENVWWFLSCWAENGFQDLQELLNRTNDLAMRKNKNQNQALV